MMGFFREMLRYGLVYHAAKSGTQNAIEKQTRKLAKRQSAVPFETTINLRIPVDDNVSLEDLSGILSNIEIDAPSGVSIDTINLSAALVDNNDTFYLSSAYKPKIRIPAQSESAAKPPVGMSREEKRKMRAEERKRQEEEIRSTMQSLAEMDAFLKDHSPEEYEQWLLEHS